MDVLKFIYSVGSIFVVLCKATLNYPVLTGVFRPLIVSSGCILEQNHWVKKSELLKVLDTHDLIAFQEGLNSFLSL